eukprot:Colp12_sorted_trinity150504_noHs@7007
MKCFERAAVLVRGLDVFSKNEHLEDINTVDMRYLLIPAYLADLQLRIVNRETRLEDIKKAQDFAVHFLDRCKELRFLGREDIEMLESSAGSDPTAKRLAKLNKFKREKEITTKLKELTLRLEEQRKAHKGVEGDEEIDREYAVELVRSWVIKMHGDMDASKQEYEMLEHMQKIKSGEIPAPRPEPKGPVMKPITITREQIERTVFGAGYPSLPTMTLDQYLDLEQQRGNIISGGGTDPPKKEVDQDNEAEVDEATYKARAWDEYVFHNPKGSGNTMVNRG